MVMLPTVKARRWLEIVPPSSLAYLLLTSSYFTCTSLDIKPLWSDRASFHRCCLWMLASETGYGLFKCLAHLWIQVRWGNEEALAKDPVSYLYFYAAQHYLPWGSNQRLRFYSKELFRVKIGGSGSAIHPWVINPGQIMEKRTLALGIFVQGTK